MSKEQTILVRGGIAALTRSTTAWLDANGRVSAFVSSEFGNEVVVLPEDKRIVVRVFLVEDGIGYAVPGDNEPTEEDWAWANREVQQRREQGSR